MPVPIGSRFGPYEILSLLGSGGMGEVYRGHDSRIGRDVAIKVLPSAFAENEDRLRRFEQEARSAGTLNHPNILVLYDLGTHETSPYLVCEYLEGETLRARIRAPLSPRRALEYAKQIANGLAAAHEKGIIHRDLKPENIFITKDERIKILDFGLAKLTEPQPDENVSLKPTQPVATGPGIVLGTVGYMSPEQVKGLPADARSDIFGFGTILYEMLTGKRAFSKASPMETMSAILNEDPQEVSELVTNLSPALDRITRHCLEKNPEARFQSARDLAFDLEMISESSPGATDSKKLKASKSLNLIKIAAALIAILFMIGGAFWAGKKSSAKVSTTSTLPVFQRLTFSRGTIQSARFFPDGKSVAYSASWRGAQTPNLYDVRTDALESRTLGIPGSKILSISKMGQMALLVKNSILAQVPLAGGTPREIIENVYTADWSPDGKDLAVVRYSPGKHWIEYPIGKMIFETDQFISYIRFSPDGQWIAFSLHPGPADLGNVAIIDLAGKMKCLSKNYFPTSIAWKPDSNEIWFSTWSTQGVNGFFLNGLSVDGKERTIFRLPTFFTLRDISPTGEILMTIEEVRSSIYGFLPGDTKEKDYSWLDWSELNDVSSDGKTILFHETGEGAADSPVISYFRRIEEDSPVKLGITQGYQISSDSKHIFGFSLRGEKMRKLFIAPTGPGVAKEYPLHSIDRIGWAGWMPGEKEILFSAAEKGRKHKLYLQNVSGGSPRAVSPEGILVRPNMGKVISPDGKSIIFITVDDKYSLYALESGKTTSLSLSNDEFPIQWSVDGRFIYAFRSGELPARIFAMDVSTGKRKFIRELLPHDATGVTSINTVRLLPDGQHYAYDFNVNLGTLHLVKGVH
jgi:eukaryotic-like serine/threonine-protein kinase